jgi:hypothetical protein
MIGSMSLRCCRFSHSLSIVSDGIIGIVLHLQVTNLKVGLLVASLLVVSTHHVVGHVIPSVLSSSHIILPSSVQ